jgi:uroporphyrinogen decarboxylase
MSENSKKAERIRQALGGEAVDQRPFSFWTHLPGIDLDPMRLAEETNAFFREYDVDFVKTMPNGMYAIEDFGCEIDYSDIPKGGVARIVSTPVSDPADWDRIAAPTPETGALGRELASLHRLLGLVKGDAPVIFTVFSPLTVAHKLSGNRCLGWIREGRETERLHRALATIADTLAVYFARAVEQGAAGVFFATQTAGQDELTPEQYAEFGAAYDLRALDGAREGWFNVLHLHGDGVRFHEVLDYPVQALNWHVWETAPTMAEARAATDKCLVGGIDRRLITAADRKAVAGQIDAAWEQSQGKGHIVTPGCTIRYPLDRETLSFIRAHVHEG